MLAAIAIVVVRIIIAFVIVVATNIVNTGRTAIVLTIVNCCQSR